MPIAGAKLYKPRTNQSVRQWRQIHRVCIGDFKFSGMMVPQCGTLNNMGDARCGWFRWIDRLHRLKITPARLLQKVTLWSFALGLGLTCIRWKKVVICGWIKYHPPKEPLATWCWTFWFTLFAMHRLPRRITPRRSLRFIFPTKTNTGAQSPTAKSFERNCSMLRERLEGGECWLHANLEEPKVNPHVADEKDHTWASEHRRRRCLH